MVVDSAVLKTCNIFSLFYLYMKIYHVKKIYFVDKPERGLFCTSFCSFQDGVKFGSVVIELVLLMSCVIVV